MVEGKPIEPESLYDFIADIDSLDARSTIACLDSLEAKHACAVYDIRGQIDDLKRSIDEDQNPKVLQKQIDLLAESMISLLDEYYEQMLRDLQAYEALLYDELKDKTD